MEHMELPLVFFTVLSQAAIGLILINVLFGLPVTTTGSRFKIPAEPQTAFILLLIGLGASILHLGHPLGAVHALDGLGASWLSREILTFSILALLLAIAAGLSLKGKNTAAVWIVAGLVGIAGVIVQSFTYTPPSQPTLAGGVTLIFFIITVTILGTALNSCYAPESKQAPLAGVLGAALLLGLILNLLIPSMWLAGRPVAEATALMNFSSPLYWAHLIISFVLPLVVLAKTKRIPGWLVVLLLLGELIGRIAFFSLAVTTAARIGLQI